MASHLAHQICKNCKLQWDRDYAPGALLHGLYCPACSDLAYLFPRMKVRLCLKCGTPFRSLDFDNRNCPVCREENQPWAGVEDTPYEYSLEPEEKEDDNDVNPKYKDLELAYRQLKGDAE